MRGMLAAAAYWLSAGSNELKWVDNVDVGGRCGLVARHGLQLLLYFFVKRGMRAGSLGLCRDGTSRGCADSTRAQMVAGIQHAGIEWVPDQLRSTRRDETSRCYGAMEVNNGGIEELKNPLEAQ